MSSSAIVSITCPVCHREHEFRIWRSVNTVLDPELKEMILNNELFRFKCPSCGKETMVDYGFLYHQMDDRIMIHYAMNEENVKEIYNMVMRQRERPDDPMINAMIEAQLYRIAEEYFII